MVQPTTLALMNKNNKYNFLMFHLLLININKSIKPTRKDSSLPGKPTSETNYLLEAASPQDHLVSLLMAWGCSPKPTGKAHLFEGGKRCQGVCSVTLFVKNYFRKVKTTLSVR